MMSTYPMTLYFDGSCPLCQAEMSYLHRCDSQGRLRLVDVSQPGFVSPLESVTVTDLMALMHARAADGRILVGVPVFELAYAAVGLHQVAGALRWGGWRWLLERLYPWVARYRQHVPKVLVKLIFGKALHSAASQAAARRCDADQCSLRPTPTAEVPLLHEGRR